MDFKIAPMFPFKVIGFQKIFDNETAYTEIPKFWKYFPKSYTPAQIENTIFKLLDSWLRKRQRDQSR